MAEQALDEIGTDRLERVPRQLQDVLAIGVLSAVTFRIAASLASGGVRIGTHAPGLVDSGTARVAEIIFWLADFGDGIGVLFAAVALGLVWWHVSSVPPAPSTESRADTRKPIWLCTWTAAVFAMTAVASLAYTVAVWMAYWSEPDRWLRITGSGFYVSYCAIGLLGVYASRQLLSRARLLAAHDDIEEPVAALPS